MFHLLICHNHFVFFPFVFFLSSTQQSHLAYLDDEDDEDPFGDYVISK